MEVPRLKAKGVEQRLLDSAIAVSFLKLGYVSTGDQKRAIQEFVKGRDVFVSIPTGEGKSLCFVALPYVFDHLKCKLFPAASLHTCSSIVLVVSPLTSLMKDQVAKYGERGMKCTYVGEEQADAAVKAGVAAGHYQLVYVSPESLLCVLEWREMLRSDVYQRNLVAIVVDEAHCVEKWGQTFRQEFNNIGEARSIIPHGVNMMALTATATRSTRQAVQASLCMHNCYVICKLPNKVNIKYMVKLKPEDESAILLGIVEDIRSKGINADKCIIFCPTYNDCNIIFQALVDLLGECDCLYLDGSNVSVCNLFTAAGDTEVKDAILEEFTKLNGNLFPP